MNLIKNAQTGLLVLPAIFMGAYVAQAEDVSLLAFVPNIAAAFLGTLFFLAIKLWANFIQKKIFFFSLITLFIISLSFFSHGLESVHRWVALGPIFLNVSMIFTPVILYGMACCGGFMPLILSISLSIIFIFQPDTGQATAFALASVVIFIFNHSLNRQVRIIGGLFAFSSALFAWKNPDPVLPVKHVEQILQLAFKNGIFIFSITLVSILFLHLPFILTCLKKRKLTTSFLPLSFSAYLLMSFIVTQFGNFPVPVVGAGASPVLGWFLMVSFLSVSHY